jgi:hypothetical protein
MIVAITLALVIGVALAQFFRALVLIPTTIVALIGIISHEAARGHTVFHTLMATLSIAVAIQVSFLFGAFLKGIDVYGTAPHLALRSSRRDHR